MVKMSSRILLKCLEMTEFENKWSQIAIVLMCFHTKIDTREALKMQISCVPFLWKKHGDFPAGRIFVHFTARLQGPE